MSAEVRGSNSELPEAIGQLNKELEGKIHLLATTGDELFAQKALESTKAIFEIGLNHEQDSHQHLHPFLLQILEPPSVSLRSKTKAKGKGKKEATPEEEEKIEPSSILPYTPLSALTVDGMDVEQIWAQLELRTEGIVQVIKQVGPGTGAEGQEDEDQELDEDELDSDDEDGSDEEMSIEEFKRMMMEQGIDEEFDSDEGEEGSDTEGDEDEDEDDDEEEDESDEDDTVRFRDEDEELGSLGSAEDDENAELEWEDEDDEEGEDEEDGEDDEDEEEEVEGESDEEDGLVDEDDGEAEEDDQTALFGSAEPGPSRRKKHPTLDDDFFSIDEFNRLTEEAEAGKLSGGRLGGDEDEDEDDLGDAGAMMLQGAGDEDAEIMYGDFFEAPRGTGARGAPKGKGKEKSGKSKDKKGKGRAKLRFADEDGEDEQEDDEDGDDVGRDVMSRFKGDLFDDDSEEEADEKNLSTHERQQLALAKQIAELEQEAIGPKDWTLLGEATSRARPENSLLEEDLDFEQVARVVPVVTEDSVKSLEDLIKKRILDNDFNSPVRVRAYEPTPYLPSRFFDLQDTQSAKSLSQIYEEEYQAAAAGGKTKDPRDEKLRKEHEEIDKIWGEICYKLDALSSLNFVPKQPKAQITTIDNLPTTSMESALPPTAAATTLLAPEELFAPPSSRTLVSRSELTPEEAAAARAKRRREKKGERKRLGDMAELYGKKGGVKGEKERALKDLVKTGKGVTVVGKGGKEMSKVKRRAEGADGEREDGKRLKL